MSATIDALSALGQALGHVSGPVVGLGGLVIGLLSYLAGRRKATADWHLTRAQTRKAEAEADKAEAQASLETIAGDIKGQLDDIREELASGMDLVHTRISSMQAEIGEIKHEVTPNHGGSIKDAVKRIEDAQRDDRALAAQRAQETAAQLALIVETHQTSQEVAARDRQHIWAEIGHLKGSITIP